MPSLGIQRDLKCFEVIFTVLSLFVSQDSAAQGFENVHRSSVRLTRRETVCCACDFICDKNIEKDYCNDDGSDDEDDG